jgi:Uma2 family endonuclease
MADLATTPQIETPTELIAFDPFDGFVLEVPADALTYRGFLRWATSDVFPEKGRIDYLGGRLHIDMAAQELNSHVKLKQAIQSALDAFATENDMGEVLGDGALFAGEVADCGTEPDAMLRTFESIESGRVRYVDRIPDSGRLMTVEGHPDLIVEIISNSSVGKDTKELRDRYFAAGVREYWIIDARGVRLSFTLLLRGENDWSESSPDAKGFRRSEVLGRRIQLKRGTTRVGTVKYEVLIEA